jgi:L-seryl-tRNA(Ser) seleniumtransferase
VLLVHSSNFALRGFVEKPSVSALSKALPQRIVCIVDQGSGSTQEGLDSEPSVSSLLRAGADLVCFSGDKILGGPQAGLIVGRADLIGLLAKHPLMRAFRPGKTILSLLEASLAAKLRGNERQGPFAAQAALRLSAEKGMKTLRVLGRKILRLIPQDFKAGIRLTQTHATLGGGSTPDETMPSLALRLSSSHSARAVTSALRQAPVPLVARIEDESVLIDLIALADEDPRLIAQTIVFALTKEAP